MWEIEKIVSKGDYNYAVVHEHPNATKHGYVLEHRIVMENYLGRLLDDDEIVHHLDEDRKRNPIENLELCLESVHKRYHFKTGRKMVRLKCPECNVIFDRELRQTFLQKGSEYTCCSMSCRGRFSSRIQYRGRTSGTEYAIATNLVKIF